MGKMSSQFRQGQEQVLYQAVDESDSGPADSQFADQELENEWDRLFGRLAELLIERNREKCHEAN